MAEDEFLLAAMASDMLRDLGAEVVGPAHSIEQAIELARVEKIDAAVLDINMKGAPSYPVADVLHGRGVPVVFATGYGEARWEGGGMPVVLDKPYTKTGLSEALTRVLGD